MKKKLFIVEFRDEINKRNWFIVRKNNNQQSAQRSRENMRNK